MTKYRLKVPKDTEEDLFTLALRSYEESGEIITENFASTGHVVTVRGVHFKVPTIRFDQIPKEFLELIKDSEFDKWFFKKTMERPSQEQIDVLGDCWKASQENRDLLYKDLIDEIGKHFSVNFHRPTPDIVKIYEKIKLRLGSE